MQKHKITPLLDGEIPAFLKAIEADSEFKNAYAFCLYTGLREGECLGLTWDKVDLKGGCISIEQQLQKDRQKSGTYFIKNATKTKKTRTVYLTEDAVTCLEMRKTAGRKREAGWRIVGQRVELGFHKRPWPVYSPDDILQALQKNCRKNWPSGFAPPRPAAHLGHRCDRSGSDVKSLQDMLGHTTAAMTLDVYAHPSDKRQREVVGGIQERFRGLAKGEEKQGQ